jgi:hypothetical protein
MGRPDRRAPGVVIKLWPNVQNVDALVETLRSKYAIKIGRLGTYNDGVALIAFPDRKTIGQLLCESSIQWIEYNELVVVSRIS